MAKQILVVDDESVTRRLVTHALKTIHVDVVAAEDGEEALALAEEHDIQLAIVDINLPDIDGFTLLEKLKALPDKADLPILIFTARNHPGDEQTAKDKGAVGLLYKPFSTQELRDVITHHLS